jgi:hypothetical protein
MRGYMTDYKKGRSLASRIDEQFKDVILPVISGHLQATEEPHRSEGERRLIKTRIASV